MNQYDYNISLTNKYEKAQDNRALNRVFKMLRSSKTSGRREGYSFVLSTVYGTVTIVPTKSNTLIRFADASLRVVNTDKEAGDDHLIIKRTMVLHEKLRSFCK